MGRGNVTFTQESFEGMCREVHGDKYDYSYDVYTGMNNRYNISCKVHGIFSQTPASHIHAKQGCSDCYKDDLVADHKKNHLEFLENKFKGKYSIVDWYNYRKLKDTLLVKCNTHSEYETSLNSLKNSPLGNCPDCKVDLIFDEFVKKSTSIHGGRYTYCREYYTCSRTEMKIYCNIHNKFFYQRPSAHLQGQNCPDCGRESGKEKMTLSQETFISRVVDKFGDKFDYTKTVYLGMHIEIIITCRVHLDITTTPVALMSSDYGCEKCGIAYRKEVAKNSFLDRVTTDSRYSHLDFSEVEYVNNITRVTFFCKDHNECHSATPNKILDSQGINGCKTCARLSSGGRWSLSGLVKIPNIRKKVGYFYSGKITNLQGVKIGITANLLNRFSGYKTDLKKYDNGCFNYIDYVIYDYYTCAVIEVVLKKVFKKVSVKHPLEFGGKNEVFDIEGSQILLDIFQGVYDNEFHQLSHIVSSGSDKEILSFVRYLKEKYNIT